MEKKLISLQGLRGLAFLAILTSHTYLTELGPLGVSVFLILSGFLMTFNYYDKGFILDIKSSFIFSKNKIGKLYKLYILTLFCALPAVISHLSRVSEALNMIIKLIFNIFLIQAWIPKLSFNFFGNSVAWYLSMITFIYFIFSFILSRIKKYKSIKQALLCSIIAFFASFAFGFMVNYLTINITMLDDFSKWFTYIFPLYRSIDFFIGCNLGYIFKKMSESKKVNGCVVLWSILEVVSCIILFISYYCYCVCDNSFFEGIKYSCIFIFPTSLLIYSVANNFGIVSKVISLKIFVYFGNISSSAFLIHNVFVIYLKRIFVPVGMKNIMLLTLFVLLLTVVFTEIYNKKIKEKKHE